MTQVAPLFRTRLARSADDLRAAQRLRYRVFVEELGAGGPLVDHAARLEIDARDAFADHLLLENLSIPQTPVIGVYRLMTPAQAIKAGGFATAEEFDLDPLFLAGRPLLELGRSCLLPAYRGGPAMMHLLAALARLPAVAPDTVLFGVASFHGTDTAPLAGPLAYLHHNHLAGPSLRVRAKGAGCGFVPDCDAPDRKATLRRIPPLIKAYLRLGGVVGEGAFVDIAFNTTDVCMILDTAAMTSEQRRRLTAGRLQ